MTFPQETTYNQRQWIRQRQHPRKCSNCKKKIIFLKDARWVTFPCDAVKVLEKMDGRRIMEESGLITTIGDRIGWPIHECSIKNDAES